MTRDEQNDRLKKIDTENFIWVIYLVIIGLCFYGNYFEKKYIVYYDLKSKEKYREITIFIFTIALIVYCYFLYDGYKDIKSLNSTDSKKKKDLTELNFLGTTLIFISGIIFLYIAITDTDLDTEIAFA